MNKIYLNNFTKLKINKIIKYFKYSRSSTYKIFLKKK